MSAASTQLTVDVRPARERGPFLRFAVGSGIAFAAFIAGWPPAFRGNALAVGSMLTFSLAALCYLLTARAVLGIRNRRLAHVLFGLANIGGIALFLNWQQGVRSGLFFLIAYVVMVSFHYFLLRRFSLRGNPWPWIAFASPLVALAVLRYAGFLFVPLQRLFPALFYGPLDTFFVGSSYIAFRLSLLVVEVRNRVVPLPTYWQYLGYGLFVPTLVAGPINPYSVHQAGLRPPEPEAAPWKYCVERVTIGLAKYQFLGALLNQLAYEKLLLDGHPHPPLDLLIAAVAYHLYLYCNFSGFCDIAIGGSGFLGIHVMENFRNPLGSRNAQEYWTRWHMTLSAYMRDVVFTPFSKWFARQLGHQRVNHAIALAIVSVFLIIGIWHGAGWNYVIYGAIHGVGVATVHYYTIFLKRRFGPAGYRAYQRNRIIHVVAVAANFVFVTVSLFFFANDMATINQIFNSIQF